MLRHKMLLFLFSEMERPRYDGMPLFQLPSVAGSLCEALGLGAAQASPAGRRLQRTAMLWKKAENALLICLANPALGDEPGYQFSGRNIESVIGGGAGFRAHPHLHLPAVVPAFGVVHFLGTAFLDRDLL